MSALAPTLQAFFTDRLVRERGASPRTVASYRDTWRLFVDFAARRSGRPPSLLGIDDVDASAVVAFLDYVEVERHNSARTRNVRLAAIHSFFSYAALRHPEHSGTIARVLAIAPKRFERALVTFLTEEETDALLAAPAIGNWTGRRDRALLVVALQCGLRISELIGLCCSDVHVGVGAHVACRGKGRKERVTPLTGATAAALRDWLAERGGSPDEPLFPTRTGGMLSRDAVEHRLAIYVGRAQSTCPSLAGKRVTAHVLRHTCAMRLLEAGVDTTVIALWLGHEQVETTAIYLHAHLGIKERALERTRSPSVVPGRYRPTDSLLAFLEAL
ncbi:MAG: tyrosine-type recombinase/integrase [Acidimicrobiales bacterium]